LRRRFGGRLFRCGRRCRARSTCCGFLGGRLVGLLYYGGELRSLRSWLLSSLKPVRYEGGGDRGGMVFWGEITIFLGFGEDCHLWGENFRDSAYSCGDDV
jgi:hypothetical protein